MTTWFDIKEAAEAAGVNVNDWLERAKSDMFDAVINVLAQIRDLPNYEARRLYYNTPEMRNQVDALIFDIVRACFPTKPGPEQLRLFDPAPFTQGFEEGR